MAHFPRKSSLSVQNVGSSASLQSLATEGGQLTPTVLISMYKALQVLLSFVFGGRIPLGAGIDGENTGALDGQWRRTVSPATPDEPFPVPHGLGRTPIGFLIWDTDVPVNVYRDTTRPWTSELVWLRADAASASLLVQLI